MSEIVFDNDFEEWWNLNYSDLDKKGYLALVGKGIKEAMPRGGQLPLDQVVIQNQFK